MPFMVIHRNADGSAGYEQLDAIDGAARFVEQLRNNESIDQIRLFRMEEINFAFRPYYKVELGRPERPAASVDKPGAVAKETNGTTTASVAGSATTPATPRLGLFQR